MGLGKYPPPSRYFDPMGLPLFSRSGPAGPGRSSRSYESLPVAPRVQRTHLHPEEPSFYGSLI